MLTLGSSTVLSVTFPIGAAVAANADPQNRPSSDHQLSVMPSPAVAPASRALLPATWYYDPYTSGSTVSSEGGGPGEGDVCSA
jgi:hypothetical protein